MKTILYVPANREDFINKIAVNKADVYMLDLEDSVPFDEKPIARDIIRRRINDIKNMTKAPIYVRLNSFKTGLTESDLDAVVHNGISGVCITKCDELSEVRTLDHELTRLEDERGVNLIRIQLLIETAKGIFEAYKLAGASKRVDSMVFGAVDYTTQMQIKLEQPVGINHLWARSMVACAAVAANVIAIDCPYVDYSDIAGFKKDTEFGKSLGYKGRVIVHPSQVEIASKLYAPSKNDIEWANEIVAVFEKEALAKGRASVAHNGKMIAIAVYRNAKRIVEMAEYYG